MGAYGLAWASAIVAFVEVAILFVIMSRQIKGLFDREMVFALSRMVNATAIMSIVTYVSVQLMPFQADDVSFFASFPKFLTVSIISLTFYVFVCKQFKLEEVEPVLAKLKTFLFGKLKKS